VAALRPKEGQHDVNEMNNDTLEYLGDSVLELLAPLFWITEGRGKKEVLRLSGFSLTNRALQAVCLSLGLEEFLLSVTEDIQAKIVGTLTEYEAAWTKDPNGAYWETVCDYKPLADVMEAIFGAVFLDCGMKMPVVQQLFRRLHWPAVNGYT
jgi:dsRNA-specific ribonuclease